MNACKSLLTVVFAVGSLALFAGYDTTYVSQYTDGSSNPYYAGAPEGAHVYAKLADGYANVNAGGTVWVEDGFVCEEGKSEAHGYNRLNIGKVLTMRSRSGKWETWADIRSKDLAGKPRIFGGAPDMGCYERKGKGLQLLVR